MARLPKIRNWLTSEDAKGTYVSLAPSPADITIGNRPLQVVSGNKKFSGLVVFGNNPGLLAADPRQPFQVNNVIDGSTLDGTTFGSDKVGFVLDVTFKGGFSAEAGFGVADPAFLFGADDFIITGTAAGDLAGISDLFARISEAHLRTPAASLAHLTGIQGQANVDAAATISGGAYAVKGIAAVTVTGATVGDLFSVYAQAPTVAGGSTVTRARALFADGMSQFTGDLANSSGSGAPSKGAYLGIAGSGAVGLELSNGVNSDNFSISNDQGGNVSFALAGTAVLATISKTGKIGTPGSVSAGTSATGTNVAATPNAQGAAKGAYLGRNSGGTVGVELADGTTSFRLANDSAGSIVLEKSGVAVLGKWNGSGDYTTTGHVSVADGKDIIAGATNGLRVGTASTQKLGFYGAAPIVRPTLPAAGVVTAADIRTALLSLGVCA